MAIQYLCLYLVELCFKMEKSLLLDSSIIFDHSNLVDRIRQSFIEIENEIPSEDSVEQLFFEIITYLDKDLNIDTAKELFSLILSCFSHYTNKILPLFDQLIETSSQNANHIIITVSILFYFIYIHPISIQNNYQSFINDCLNQLLPQIQKNDETILKIYDHEIYPQFQNDLIINLLLLTQINQNTVSIFSPFLLSHDLMKDNSKMDLLLAEISKNGYIFDISPEILPSIVSKMDFSIDSMLKYVSLLSDETFKFVYPQIEKVISKSNGLTSTFSITILSKCEKCDITVKPIKKLIDTLTIYDLTAPIIEYLNRYKNYDFEEKFSQNLIEFPSLENFPEDDMNRILLETKDLSFYLSFFPLIKKFHPVLSSPEMWTNIVSIASKSKDEISKEMNEQFRFYFQRFVKSNRLEDVLDGMIFSIVPQTLKGMNFIVQLLKDPKSKVRKKFFNDKNMAKYLLKIKEKKIIPRSSFWTLFSRTLVFQEYMKDRDPLFLYGYLFANGGFEQDFNKIGILPLTEASKSDIYDYIKHDKDQFEAKYELKNEMEDAAISLIACAFLFTRFEGIVPVEGITVEVVLPFLAVSFDFMDSIFDKDEDRNEVLADILGHFNPSQPFCILKKGLKLIGEINSPLLNISIDTILPYLYRLFSPEYFSLQIGLTVLHILIPFLLKGSYNANKMTLLSTIFQFSHGEHELNKELSPEDVIEVGNADLLLIYQNNSSELFKFILNNLDEINNSEILKETSLNLAIFDQKLISQLIIDTIQNSSSTHEAVKFIYFIEKLCINAPELQLTNLEKIESILQDSINEEKGNEASLVYQFMLKNGLGTDLHHLNKFPLLLSYLEPSSNQLLLEILFKNLMNDESAATGYLVILLQKIINNNHTTAELILKNYSKEFQKYENSFTKAVNLLFVADLKNDHFIQKPEFESYSSFCSEFALSVISNIFNSLNEKRAKCNAFIIMKNIASSFPFLFESKSLQIFNSILPSLSDFSLIFEEDEETNESRIKATISALSFLLSTLCSPKILDDFVIWLFNNIKTFNESQILSFLVILRSLMNIGSIKLVLTSQMIKFNLIEVIKNSFQHDLQEDLFRNNYLSVIYGLLECFYDSLRNLTPKDEIFIDELMTVENPFQTVSLFILHYHQDLTLQLQLKSSKKKDEIFNFLNKIDSIKPFWFTFDFVRRTTTENQNSILNAFLSKVSDQSEEINSSISVGKMPKTFSNQMLHYLAKKPSWMFKWIENPKDFLLLPRHYQILDQVINDLNNTKDEEEVDLYNFLDLYREKSLFEKLVEQSTTQINQQTFSSLCSLLLEISQKETGLISILKCINEVLSNVSIDLKSIKRIVDILKIVSVIKGFKYDFIDICGSNLLDAILIPEFRTKSELLVEVSKLFSILYPPMPNRIVHLIDLMLLLNDQEIIHYALVLSAKIEKPKQDLLMPVINHIFDKFISGDNKLRYNEISLILDVFPDVAKDRRPQLLKLLDHLLEEYKIEDDKFHDNEQERNDKQIYREQILELIGSLFNILAPNRSKVKQTDSIPSFESRTIPSSIIDSDPDFWHIFSKYYLQIIKGLYQNPQLLGTTVKFLLDYPELIEFNIRRSYFNEIKKKLSEENSIEFNVARMSILNESMTILNHLPIQDFLKSFKVQFVGEKMKTRIGDFYRTLVRELFHPKNYYFIYTENRKSFQINPRSNLKTQHLDYFRFAGKMIARALLEEESLNIHLTPSLYKILLQRPFELNDLKEIDRDLYNSLYRKLNEDLSKVNEKDDDAMVFTLDLACSDEEEEEEEFKDDDDDINQSPQKSNQLYVDSEIDYRLKGLIKDQVKAFCDGFYMVIPFDQIKFFTPVELDLLICGMPIIDVGDLKRNIEFEYPYNYETPTVKLFFNAIEKWDQDKLSQLVMFITKSSQSIISGFRTLKENGNPIKIAPLRDTDLPQSFPFINMLLLPEYDDEDFLNWKFVIAFNDDNSNSSNTKRIRNKRS